MAIMDYKPLMKHEGRWYRIFVESDGTTLTVTESDIDGVTFGGDNASVLIPEGFIPMFCMEDFNYTTAVGAARNMGSIATRTSATQYYITMPRVDMFDWGYIYVFGYYNRD